MDITWFLVGIGVGATATYIWLRTRTRERHYQNNLMTNSPQQSNSPSGAFAPPATANRPSATVNGSDRSHLEAQFAAVKTILGDLQNAVIGLQKELADVIFALQAISPNLHEPHNRPEAARNHPSDTAPRFGTATIARRQGTDNALVAYRKLSFEGLRDLPVEPRFVVLDMDSSARGSAIGETKRHFKESESKQSAFVVFSEGEREGWIFPNPRISFTEAMKYVFPDLSYENFEEAKDRVEPQRVRSVSQGAWETVVT